MASLCRGCTRIATHKGYCDKCRRIPTIVAPRKKQRVRKPWNPDKHYELEGDERMKKLRKTYLWSNIWCARCVLLGKQVLASELDHIIPVRVAADLKYETSNFQGLCRKCHGFKTNAETFKGIAYDYIRRIQYDLSGKKNVSKTESSSRNSH